MKLRLILLIAMLGLLITKPGLAQEGAQLPILMPMGGNYSEIYAGFSETVAARAKENKVQILVLPIAYASNPETITEVERENYLVASEERRSQIEEACKRAALPGIICLATLAPIFVRSDAVQAQVTDYFPKNLTAVFILGGDQTIARQVIADTLLEEELTEAYQNGTIIAGTSAGGAVQSKTMLGGYNPNYSASNSLDFGAVDIWNTPSRQGLPFGIQRAILDQHFFQRGRMGRLLNAITLPGVPHIGIGIDASTGAHIVDGVRVENVFGLYTVAILDAETYHAANAIQYHGKTNTISLRNVLVHLLSAGDSAYDLTTRQHALGAPEPVLERDFQCLKLPTGAGSLILGGKLEDDLGDAPVLTQFVNLAGGEKANILIIAAGYPSEQAAESSAQKYRKALGIPAQLLVIPQDTSEQPAPPEDLPENITGIILVGQDQSKIQIESLPDIKQAWLSGIPLLADNAAAAVIGMFYSAHGPTPSDGVEAELSTQQSFIAEKTTLLPGLGLLECTFEPQIVNDNRWGRLFSLAYKHPELLAFGINEKAALFVTENGARVSGENIIAALDMRSAKLSLGINQGFVIANGMIDIFAPEDMVYPQRADVNAAPIHAATPILPTLTPIPPTPTIPTRTATLEPSATPTIKPPKTPKPTPTKTPRPTPTPPTIPPPTSAEQTNTMIAIAAISVIIILLGMWINRTRLN